MPGTLTRSPVSLSQTPVTTLAGLASALAFAGALPALAQQVYDLDEITVIANRVPTEIARSGASVSIVSREALEASGTVQLADYINRLAGVSLTQDGGPGSNTTLRIRGADRRYIAVYIDGIRVDDPSSTSVQYDFGHLTTADVERIEVLRGSQSALYGGSAVGGVINITTRRPEAEGFSQEAAVEIGSFNTRAARYTLAFRDDRLEAALTLAHRATDGFSAWEGAPGTPDYNPNYEADGFRFNRLSGSMRYQASEAFAWGLSGFLQNSVKQYDGFDPATYLMLGNSDFVSRQRHVGARAFVEYDTGTTLHEFSASGDFIRRDEYDAGTLAGEFEGRRNTLSYQATTAFSSRFSLVLGADTMLEQVRAASLPSGSEQTRTTGIYSQALWAPTDQLDINATVRMDRHSAFGTFATGRLALAWQLDDGITLRGAVARGFRAPSIDELYGDYPTFFFTGNPALTPETSRSVEIGIDRRWSSGATLSATLFALETDNLITSQYSPTLGMGTLVNIPGASPRRGLELSGSIPLNERISLSGSYTYTDARTADGERLARVPRHDLALGVDAKLADRLRGSLSVQHVAGRPEETNFNAPFPYPVVPMPDYTVANVNFRYALNDMADLTLRIDNLFDQQYQHTLGHSSADRSFYLGVAARF